MVNCRVKSGQGLKAKKCGEKFFALLLSSFLRPTSLERVSLPAFLALVNAQTPLDAEGLCPVGLASPRGTSLSPAGQDVHCDQSRKTVKQ